MTSFSVALTFPSKVALCPVVSSWSYGRPSDDSQNFITDVNDATCRRKQKGSTPSKGRCWSIRTVLMTLTLMFAAQ